MSATAVPENGLQKPCHYGRSAKRNKGFIRLSCPLPPNTPTPSMTELGDEFREQLEQVSHLKITGVFGHLLADVNYADKAISNRGMSFSERPFLGFVFGRCLILVLESL